MKGGKKSSAWMRRHVNDPYVRRARSEGYRSRAAFKLLQMAEADRLLRPGMLVVDLGAAPGSWSQVAAAAVGATGRVLALDLLEMEPLPGVHCLQGDFREPEALRRLELALEGRKADLVLCDMAPNLSGVAISDQARSRELCDLALEFAERHLKPGGSLLIKAFQGSGYRDYMEALRRAFRSVVSRKPGASRDRSAEMYLLAKGFNGAHRLAGGAA
jgi:23S rRNA (uridine2552-2'-O)-methyltransferase